MVLVAMLVMIAGVTLWALRDDNGGRVVAPPSTSLSAVVRATSEVATESTAPAASPGTVRADSGGAAPGHAGDSWYWLDLPGVVAKETTVVQADPLPGSSTRIWVSEDDSFSRVVVLHLFAGDPGFTTLAGTERTDVQSPGGTAYLLADAADVAETDGPGRRSNEFRWVRADGAVYEFSSFGLDASELVRIGLTVAEPAASAGYFYQYPGLTLMVNDDGGGAGVTRQEIVLDGVALELTRSQAAPASSALLGGAGQWQSARAYEIDSTPGVVVDGTRAVWRDGSAWFALSGIPAGRLDEVVGALRRTGGPAATTPPVAAWQPMSPSPLAGRMGAASVWTGTEIIIAGGTRDDVAGLGEEAQASNSDGVRIKVTNFADAAAYDPVTDRWRPIAAAPVDALADDAIWTGRVMLVRGILAPADPNDAPTAKMLAYEPTSDTWTSYPAPDRSSDTIGVTSVWTGTELVLWGHPYRRSETFAAAFNPTTGEWRDLPGGPLSGLFWPAAVWTGTEVIVISSETNATGRRTQLLAAALDPVTGDWRDLPPVPLGYGFEDAALLWTGTHAVVAGGSFADLGNRQVALWDAATETWSVGGMLPGAGRSQAQYLWNGIDVIELGGLAFLSPRLATSPPRTSYAGVSTIAPFTRVITRYADSPEPVTFAAAAWTGESILVWGGLASDDGLGKASASGWVLTP